MRVMKNKTGSDDKKLPWKYICLFLLVAQTVGTIIMIRISKTKSSGSRYLNTTAVVSSEVLKLLGSFILVWLDSGYSITKTLNKLNTHIVKNPGQTLIVGIPAFLYTIQNNLIFISLSNITPAVYQVTYQLKILTTALCSMLILNKKLGCYKWFCLILLTFGVILIQIPAGGENVASKPNGNQFIGYSAVIAACFTSGFSGVFFEKILKGSSISVWLRNIQLSIFGIILGLIAVYWNDGEAVITAGFFQGYNKITWVVILLQGLGGLIIAGVLKYADNILKCFGNALAIVLSCLLSSFLLNELVITMYFFTGTLLVIIATCLYGSDASISYLLPFNHNFNKLFQNPEKRTYTEVGFEDDMLKMSTNDNVVEYNDEKI